MRPPAFPIAPKDYDQRYLDGLIRILTQYLTQQDITMTTQLTTADQYNPIMIAAGLIAGKTTSRTLGRHPGVNNVITDVADFIAAGAAYVFPAAGGIQMRVVSSSANDTNTAGTGVRSVEIDYLDATYTAQSETVLLNGVTAVNTAATNILRVNKVHTMTVGSGGVAAGNIQVQNVGGTVVYSQIPASINVSVTAVFTVPLGKKFFITSWNFGSGTATGTHFTQGFLRTTSNEEGVFTDGIFQFKDVSASLNGGIDMEFNVPVVVPAKTDVKVSALSDAGAAGAICTTHFGGWLESV